MKRRTRWLLVVSSILGAHLLAHPAPADEPRPTARSARSAAAKKPLVVVKPLSAPPAPLPPPPAPSISILAAPQSNPNGTVTLDVEASTEDDSVPRIELRIDQKVVPDVVLVRMRDLALPNRFLLTFPVPPRDCVVSLIAYSLTAQSLPASERLHWTPRGVTKEAHPAMYVLAVGIDNYRNHLLGHLDYSGKDASALAEALTRQNDSIYFRVFPPRVLLDKDATRPRILEALDWLQEHVLAGDTVVIFLAGHGTKEGDVYYYLPYEAETDVHTMLSGPDLQGKLSKIHGRVFLFLDTCHSGGVIDDATIKSLTSGMTTANHIVVFAASTGAQTSLESPTWGHGAFTKALLEGLGGRADYKEDRQLSLSEMETWVNARVKELTQSHQTPNVTKLGELNYPFAAFPRDHALLTPRQLTGRKILGGLLGGSIGAAILIGVLAARPWELSGRVTTSLVFH